MLIKLRKMRAGPALDELTEHLHMARGRQYA